MARQYLKARFLPHGVRDYTWHNDGAPVAVGDLVKLPGFKPSDGWQRGEVVSISSRPPPFETKAILGLVPGEASAAPQGDLFGGATDAPSAPKGNSATFFRRRSRSPYLGEPTNARPR